MTWFYFICKLKPPRIFAILSFSNKITSKVVTIWESKFSHLIKKVEVKFENIFGYLFFLFLVKLSSRKAKIEILVQCFAQF